VSAEAVGMQSLGAPVTGVRAQMGCEGVMGSALVNTLICAVGSNVIAG
jgi:hypothetical protein